MQIRGGSGSVRWSGALAGLLAVCAAVAAGHLVAGLLEPASSPFFAVGDSAIDLSPKPVQDFAKEQFGTSDKLVLLLGMAVVLAVLGAVAGAASRRRPLAGYLVIIAMGVLGLFAVQSQGDTGGLGVLAPLASVAAGLAAFGWLWRRSRAAKQKEAAAPDRPGSGPARRTVLVGSAGVLATAAGAGLGGQALAARVDVEESRRAVAGLMPTMPRPPLPAGADFAASGTPSFITANADFYRIDVALMVPRLRAEDWSLRVSGMVDRELRLDYADLLERSLIERPITMACVSNPVGGPLISTAWFLGVPLREILREAGVATGATRVVGRSADDFTVGTPIETLLDDRDAMLALGMNGEPLPREHGFPARTVVPGLFGYVSGTKWITDLIVTTDAAAPYWERRGWASRGPVLTQSRIDTPGASDRLAPGRITVAGVAWAPHTGIDRVEVRLDRGEWLPAELSTEVSIDTWRMWRATLDVPPGEHVAEVRATDRSGEVQTARRTEVYPAGATGWHAVRFSCA